MTRAEFSPTVAPQIEALALPGCDANVPALKNEGDAWVAIKPACEALGIDARSQQRRLASASWATTVMMTAVGADGKAREMLLLSRAAFPMWLATLDASRIKSNNVRFRIAVWQKKAADVLDRWMNGEEEAPAALVPQTPPADPSLLTFARDLFSELKAMREEREMERRERQEEARAQSEERRLTMTVLADVSKLVVGLREQRTPAPALPPAAEWVNTANLCAQLGLSVSALNKKLRLRDKKAVEAARRWTRTDGYHWNVEAMRVLLRGPIPQRTWEPPAPSASALPAKVDDHGLRKSIVLYVQEACKRLGKESSEDRRTIWRDLYSAYALRSGSDPMAEARKGEKSLDVIERNKDLSTFLAICMERLPAGKEHHA